MYETTIAALVGELVNSDPAACDRDGLASLVAVSQRVRAWLDAFDARISPETRKQEGQVRRRALRD